MSRTTLSATVGVTTVGLAAVAAGLLYSYRANYTASAFPSATGPEAVAAATDTPASVRHASAVAEIRSIVVENGLLSLTLQNQMLGSVLVEIAGRSHVTIFSSPAVDARQATIELHRVPIELGLQRLLKDCDVFFYESAGALKSVWIYEKDAGGPLIPVPPESWASTADVMRQMDGASPAERISAIETLVARNGPGSNDLVSRGLLDADPDVRQRALDVGLSAGVNLSRETLTALTYDSSAPVRILALEAIAAGTPLDGPNEAETDQMIRRMMSDPDADVRAKASELLDSRHPPS
jgi:hypothetical protein